MLLARYARERLEPVREVRCAFLDRPLLHGMRDDVRNFDVKRLALFDGLEQGFIRCRRKSLLHRMLVEHHGAVDFGNLCHRMSSHRNRAPCGAFIVRSRYHRISQAGFALKLENRGRYTW